MKFFQTLTYIAIKIEKKLSWDSVPIISTIPFSCWISKSNQSQLYQTKNFIHDLFMMLRKKDAGHNNKVKPDSKKFRISLVMSHRDPVSSTDQNSSHSFKKMLFGAKLFEYHPMEIFLMTRFIFGFRSKNTVLWSFAIYASDLASMKLPIWNLWLNLLYPWIRLQDEAVVALIPNFIHLK